MIKLPKIYWCRRNWLEFKWYPFNYFSKEYWEIEWGMWVISKHR